jgi:glycosyltransferase involved in cell wall biosynthesis
MMPDTPVTISNSLKALRSTSPRVSVITIFYNAGKYLAEAIESVLAQSYRNFEFLLIDDGSNDGSTEIARDYVERFPDRLRYFEHPGHVNRGMSATRNLGLQHARGEFVAFIDGDDRWKACKLQQQVDLLDRKPDVDAVCGSVNYWESHQGGTDKIIYTGHRRNSEIRPPEGLIKLYPLGRETAPSMSDLLLRRASVLAAGGFEEAFDGAYEDQAFLIKFYENHSLYITHSVWSDYRVHPGSCSAEVDRNGTYHATRAKFLDWFEGHFASSRHRNNVDVNRVLDRALRRYRRDKRSVRARLSDSFAGVVVRRAKRMSRELSTRIAPGPAILMYHRIADERFDPWGLAVSRANFAEQVEWMARNRTVLPLSQFANLHGEGRLPPNAIAVTFDDGYACNAEVAVPLLQRLRVPATIFVPAELIGQDREFWWDELEQIVLNSGTAKLSLGDHEVELGPMIAGDNIWPPATAPRTPRQRAYHQLWSLLYNLPAEALGPALDGLREQAGTPSAARKSHRPMTTSEVRGLKSDFVEIGSHALSHASLTRLTKQEKAAEIFGSRDRCERLSGIRPKTFAYPYGHFDSECARLAERAGFICAVKADGLFVRRKSRRFALPRLFVGDFGAAELARQLGEPSS